LVQVHWKPQRQQSGGDQRGTHDSEYYLTIAHGFPLRSGCVPRYVNRGIAAIAAPLRSCHADVREQQHRPRHDRAKERHRQIDPVHVLKMRGMRRRPDRADQQIRCADDQSKRDQLRDREPVAEDAANRVQYERSPPNTAPERLAYDVVAHRRCSSVSSHGYVNGGSDSLVGFSARIRRLG